MSHLIKIYTVCKFNVCTDFSVSILRFFYHQYAIYIKVFQILQHKTGPCRNFVPKCSNLAGYYFLGEAVIPDRLH